MNVLNLQRKTGAGAGYLIKFKDGKTICVPIKTDIYPNINPVHTFRKQSVFPELDNVDVYTFIDTDVFEYPVYASNVVYLNDILGLESVETGVGLDDPTAQQEKQLQFLLYMSNKKTQAPLQILDFWTSQYFDFRKLTHDKLFTLAIPNTSLRLRTSDLNHPGALEADFEINTVSAFRCIVIGDKQDAEYVTYSDEFALQYGGVGNYIVLSKEFKNLYTMRGNLSDMMNDKNPPYYYKFKFIPLMMGYQCEDGECKPIPLSKTEGNGRVAMYKGEKVTRQQNCWGLCGSHKDQSPALTSTATASGQQYFNHSPSSRYTCSSHCCRNRSINILHVSLILLAFFLCA